MLPWRHYSPVSDVVQKSRLIRAIFGERMSSDMFCCFVDGDGVDFLLMKTSALK